MFGKLPRVWLKKKKGTIFNYTSKSMKSQGINIQRNIPLAQYTTFKIGGPAKFFCEVKNEEEVLEALDYAKENSLPVFVLGGGSNILVSDNGFSGLVIKLRLNNCCLDGLELECGAGVLLSTVVREARNNSLSGIEWAAGIPGEFGGAVRGNAGAYGGEIKDSLVYAKAVEISTGQIKIFENKNCDFVYRSSLFKENKNLIIISARLKFKKGKPEDIEREMEEVIGKRRDKLPQEFSAGSFFQNPTVENPEIVARFERDSGTESRESRVPAGWVIDELNLRGKKMGGVMVSEKHANFVVNLGKGKAEDIIMLASFIKQQARTKLGVQLHEEVQYVGF
jgi:UDP-N-acetylmuramate dehydrogenase